MNAKDEAGLNGQSCEADVTTNSAIFNTLSGFGIATCRNSWENSKLLVSEQSSPSDLSDNGMLIEKDSGHVTLVVSVEDTGIGIPLHAQDRVFTPFMQADSSTSRNYGGTGIGLSISKCLVELMGGKITFVSKPYLGSTFTFTAVLQRCTQSASANIKRSPEALPTGFEGMRAVLIDQRPVRCAVTKYHLHRLGIIVEISSSIKEARHAISGQNGCSWSGRWAKQQPFVILIEKDSWSSEMDVCLREWLLKAKQNDQIPEVPKVILLVNSESDKTKDDSCIDTMIMKPLRASTIATCFQQVLGKQQRKEKPPISVFLRALLVGKNILVVDDNKVNLRVAAGALKKYGAQVECVESGKDALALLKLPHKYDACFMDVQMPEMDGFEATRQIRLVESEANEQEEDKDGAGAATADGYFGRSEWHLPILAMTADVIQATYDECLERGMDGYVSKPFDEEQLYKEVKKFLAPNQLHS